jgi:hypothetical protein
MSEQNFPLFRRYSNGRSYFRIISGDEMEELQVIGSSYTIHLLKAKILPERNQIMDLIQANMAGIEMLNEDEYSKQVDDIKSTHQFRAL